ncbi:MAG: hypothetical protein B7Z20_01695 [Sphingobium sp. 32-64-5]|nr:MAG: hypothetical protein B7Z20_01695 [Sphingobium sp. 32-64-5]
MNKVAFSHRWVDVGGLSTRVVEAGEGDSTVLFLHGIGGHIETFCLNIAAHAKAGHRVLAIDMLGHGYTTKPDGDYEIERYVDHVLEFLEVMGVKSATFAGTSLGGWISARIAARHPEKVDRLSLIASAGLTAHPSVMHNLKTLTERASLVSGRMEIRQRNLLTQAELAKVEAPTLVVWTHNDPTATLEDGKNYANGIRDSRFVVFHESSHMPQLEEPDRFNALHLAFIADPASVQSSTEDQASSNTSQAESV